MDRTEICLISADRVLLSQYGGQCQLPTGFQEARNSSREGLALAPKSDFSGDSAIGMIHLENCKMQIAKVQFEFGFFPPLRGVGTAGLIGILCWNALGS